MFGLGPIWGLMIQPRRTGKDDRTRLRNSVHLTNLALVLSIAAMSLHDPRLSLQLLAVNAVCIVFFSAWKTSEPMRTASAPRSSI